MIFSILNNIPKIFSGIKSTINVSKELLENKANRRMRLSTKAFLTVLSLAGIGISQYMEFDDLLDLYKIYIQEKPLATKIVIGLILAHPIITYLTNLLQVMLNLKVTLIELWDSIKSFYNMLFNIIIKIPCNILYLLLLVIFAKQRFKLHIMNIKLWYQKKLKAIEIENDIIEIQRKRLLEKNIDVIEKYRLEEHNLKLQLDELTKQ